MNLHIKCTVIVVMLIINALILDWDSFLSAEDPNEQSELAGLSVRANHTVVEDHNLGGIEVISESIFGENNNIKRSRNVKLAVENENVYVVWEDNTSFNGAGSDYDIFYRHFNSRSWSDIQVISEPVMGSDLNHGASTSPAIVIDNGKLYVTWVDESNTSGSGSDSDIFFRCNLTGTTWEDIQVISEPVPGYNNNNGLSHNPDMAVNDGKIYTVWQDNNNTNSSGPDDDIFYRCNLTGTTWEPVQVISEPVAGNNFNIGGSSFPKIAVENNKTYVVWTDGNNTNKAGTDHDIFYRSNLSRTTWEPVQIISEPVVGSNINDDWSYYPDLAVESGKLHVVWVDSTNMLGAGIDSDIFYINNLTGSSWSPIQVISEPLIGSDLNVEGSLNPSITVEDETIYVAWDDMNNTYDSGNDEDIFLRYNSTGYSWEDIQVISEIEKGSDLAIYESLNPDIIVDNSMIYVAWHDGNDINGADTDLDIFYRGTPIRSFLNFPSVIPLIGNTSTLFNFTVTYKHLDDIAPKEISINIDGMNYPVIEADLNDTNYTNGKTFYYTIQHLDIGKSHVIQFFASDGDFTISSEQINKPVVNNTSPVITTENNDTAIEDEYYENIYEFEDMDVENVGQIVYWNLSTNASWLELNRTNGILNGTPSNYDVGEFWVNVTVDDTWSINFTNFTLTVIDVNDPPIIVEEKNPVDDGQLRVHYGVTDIDTPEENITWTMDTDADWLTFDPENATLNGTPEASDLGKYWVNITVDDNEGGTDHYNYTLVVDAFLLNIAPKLTNAQMLPNFGNTDTDFMFSVHYYDAEGEAPSFIKAVIDDKEFDMALDTGNSSNGTYIYMTNLSEGEHTYYFISSDGLETTRTDNLTTPYIEKAEVESKEQRSWERLILMAIIIIMIILIISILMIRGKRKRKGGQKKKKGLKS